MIREADFLRYSKYITEPELLSELDQDLHRLKGNWFGVWNFSWTGNGAVVLMGGRSGLELLWHLDRRTDQALIVYEPNAKKRQALTLLLSNLDKAPLVNVVFVTDFDELSNALPLRRIDLIRIDRLFFDWHEVNHMIDHFDVGHLCGEFDPTMYQPMEIYRACNKKVRSFFLRITGSTVPLINSRRKYQYEVSVVVPSYKVLPWIDRCMETLVGQNLKSLEIIAVDDGSPDQTGARLDEWSKNYPGRVKVIHKQNGGCASARNAGLIAAKGEFVTFVDADDWVDINMLSDLYTSAILNASDVAQCGYAEVYGECGRTDLFPAPQITLTQDSISQSAPDPKIHLTDKPTIWRRIYRKEFLDSFGIVFPEHIRRFDDLPFQFEVFARVQRISSIPDCYYFYRQEREGQDVAVRDDRLLVHFPIYAWITERVGVWGDATIDQFILRSKINTHGWALSRIDERNRFTYMRLAAHDLLNNNAHITWIGAFLRVLRQYGLFQTTRLGYYSLLKKPQLGTLR